MTEGQFALLYIGLYLSIGLICAIVAQIRHLVRSKVGGFLDSDTTGSIIFMWPVGVLFWVVFKIIDLGRSFCTTISTHIIRERKKKGLPTNDKHM